MLILAGLACPRCSGSLGLTVRLDSGEVVVECRHCLVGRASPEGPWFSTLAVPWERRAAMVEEAKAAGVTEAFFLLGGVAADDVPDPEDAAAFAALNLVAFERVPWWAAQWLADGLDGEHMRVLAGEHGDDTWAIADLLVPALEEAGAVPCAEPVEAVDRVLTFWARRCLAGRATERATAEAVPAVIAAGGWDLPLYGLPLAQIYDVVDEWAGGWGRNAEELRVAVRTACAAQVAPRPTALGRE